ncbi:HNH endonuclease domain-containing protein [Cordyceps javanica]|uniref:HNH endonuclease domain-containing protein n=1 Tax=Cordyceps javanica TaxID=43265 RepID=A0A545ULF8_9HYPO|nr:HNH endonuclease domain-containing protein [Cordyceps javanica]TQW01757.1 HNH endonuclease domain-containing protein [Cordyceps javanica]
MGSLQLKTRRPAYSTSDCQQFFFLHPGYPDGHNLLLSLPAFDSHGIHHETARVACAILANSRWDGFFSLTRDGAAVADARDAVLKETRYYFRVPDDAQYPVVPSYENFRCPTTLPTSWATDSPHIEPATTDDVGRRDLTCRVTASTLANEVAHIIPQALSEWWQRNSMFTYAANPDLSSDTRCAENAILLRRDLHKLWDDHRFAIVPKQGKWILHALWRSPSNELESEFHNLELQPLYGVARHFLLCRFALAILSKSVFLNQSVDRRLVTLDGEDTPRVQAMSANEYKNLFATARRANSRSQSPKKRPRETQGVDDGAESDGSTGSGQSEQRGRRRRRRWSPNTSPGREKAKATDKIQQILATPS